MPKEKSIEFTRGDTCPVSFELTDENGQPLNLTNTDEIYFTVKKDYSNPNVLFQKKLSTGDITQDGINFSLVIMPTDTQTLPYGDYVFDICLKSIDLTQTVCIGTMTLTNEVTFGSNE